jgi:hypothetical protein
VIAKLQISLRLLLGGLCALLDEVVDRGLRHLPPAADLEPAQLAAVDQAPGSAVVDAQQRGHLAQVEKE